jgi:HK97 family phage prohead protease
METKSFPVTEIKALPEDEPGTFEAIVACFGNVDRGGDRMKKGSFARTLKDRGLPPIIWSHNWDIPPIGTVEEAVENNSGLRIKGRLFVGEDEDSPVARQVYTAMKAKDGNGMSPLREFSFGYEAVASKGEEVEGEEIRVLEDVELFEVGPTLVGLNPSTQLLAVKSATEAIAQVVEETTSDADPDDGTAGADPLAVPEPSADEPPAVVADPTTSPVEQPEDKPDPKDEPELSEEDRSRIAELLTAGPIH